MKNIILLFLSFTVIACGGGGSTPASTPATNPNTTFVFGDYNRLSNTGDTEIWNLSGAANTGETVIARITFKNDGTTTYNGNTVNVMKGLVNIKIPSFSADATTIVTIYYDNNGTFIRSYDSDSATTCFASGTTSPEPKRVKVGDFGSITPQSCDDGETSTGTWRVEAVDSTHANIIFSETIRDNLGEISITSTYKMKIDTSGVLSDVALDASYFITGSFDFSISLTGTVQ